jgi:hypothetical protein
MNIKWPYTKYNQIDNIGFETIFLEKPISNIIDFEWRNILPSPPKNSSNITIKELNTLSLETQKRTKKDVELIHNVDVDLDSPFIYLLNRYGVSYPKQYIDLFYNIIHPVLLNTKGYWNRARPNQLADIYSIDIDVILTGTHHTAAYPSGHTVYSNLVAHILKDIYPQINQKELDYIVNETARARVLQGVHYPTDNKASLVFSKTIFNKLTSKLRKYYNDTIQ